MDNKLDRSICEWVESPKGQAVIRETQDRVERSLKFIDDEFQIDPEALTMPVNF